MFLRMLLTVIPAIAPLISRSAISESFRPAYSTVLHACSSSAASVPRETPWSWTKERWMLDPPALQGGKGVGGVW